MNPRLLATRVLIQILFHGKSLNECVIEFTQKIDNAKDRAFARQLVSGVLRYYERLDFLLSKLLKKPLKGKDADIFCLLLIGLYQVFFMRVPDHAAVAETVKLTQKFKKSWAKGFVNGVLRQSIRDKDELLTLVESEEYAKYSHPDWLIEAIKNDWPEDYQKILTQNLKQAPMVLRVNQQKHSREQYRAKLQEREMDSETLSFSDEAIKLTHACDVLKLPGFETGEISVQDQAAQLAAKLLKLENGNNVLDACAAPGGKTAHLLESNANIQVLALDVSEARLMRVKETLQRLNLKAATQCGNASELDSWWSGQLFDRILLDVPCSAIGVIRRNPDIKIHRKSEDISQLVENQRKLLNTLWQILKPGGILVYATCSVLKAENENQIAHFLDLNADANELKIEAQWGRKASIGRQIFPGENEMDGFYYARIQKKLNST